nr:hypothetical protein [Nonomuraea sp. SYSU D8015]
MAAFDRALPLMAQVGDELSQGRIHLGLAEARRGLGRRAQAIRSAERAAATMRECRVPVKETRARELLAALAEDAGDREGAAAELRRAVEVCLASGNRPKAAALRARLERVLDVRKGEGPL